MVILGYKMSSEYTELASPRVYSLVSISCVGLCWSQQCTHVNSVLLITMTSCDVTAVPGLHTVLELAVCPFGVYPRE